MIRRTDLPTVEARTSRPAATSLVFLVAACLVLLLLPSAAPADAAPDGGLEAQFVALINQERANAGLPALSVAGDLTSVGRRHAARMAAAADLHHNPNLGGDVSGWDKVGENVGRGATLEQIHAAFLASDSHRRNILDPEWREVGIGVEVVDGGLWVTELFRLPAGAPAATPASEPAEPEESHAATDDPVTDATPAVQPEPAPEPTPVAHEVVEVPLPVDRITQVLARLDAADEVEAG